jgi:hypothetical protein
MTYDTLVTAAAATTWISRVKASLVSAAIAISVDSPAAGLEARRDRLARTIMTNPEVWAQRFALPVALGFLADADLGAANATDAEIDTRVAGVFNDFLDV